MSLLADRSRSYWSAVRIEKISACILSNIKQDEFLSFISQKTHELLYLSHIFDLKKNLEQAEKAM